MKTDLENKIEEYLIDGDRWKLFIDEQLNDFENATLERCIDITVNSEKENPCVFDVSFSFKILDDKFINISETGNAKFSKNKYKIQIKNIERI